jgi:predicted nicotinamide N-methyase
MTFKSSAFQMWLAARYAVGHDNSRQFSGLGLSPPVLKAASVEWSEWMNDYLPPGGLQGKTVLDVGAGEGESAHFFFRHGASKVIAIEPDDEKFAKLLLNSEKMGWKLEPIHDVLRESHLTEIQRDFTKIDADGGETAMLALSRLDFPLTMEIHGSQMRDSLHARFPNLSSRRRRWWSDLWIGWT